MFTENWSKFTKGFFLAKSRTYQSVPVSDLDKYTSIIDLLESMINTIESNKKVIGERVNNESTIYFDSYFLQIEKVLQMENIDDRCSIFMHLSFKLLNNILDLDFSIRNPKFK